MKSKPLPFTPGNSATLHIKTPDTNGTVSYTEGSQLGKGRPGPVLPIWETTSQWGLGSLAEAVEEEEKPMAWAEPPEEAVTLYLVSATTSVLSLTLVTNVAQGAPSLPDSEAEAGPGWTAQRNADARDARLSYRDVGIVPQGILSSCVRGARGEIRTSEILEWLNLQGKCVKWLKPNLHWTYLGLRK